jgi:stage II sporulation protein D
MSRSFFSPQTVLIAGALLVASGASASENIRVAIADNQRTVAVSSTAPLRIDGTSARAEKSLTFTAASSGRKPVRISAAGAVRVNGHTYRGVIELRKKTNGLLLVVNELDLESYLLGVVAAEIPADWEMEALKAQAVASRTYALYEKRNAGRRPYHILATVDSQMYLGKRGERSRATTAVEKTRGLIITYRGDPRVLPCELRRTHRGRDGIVGHR